MPNLSRLSVALSIAMLAVTTAQAQGRSVQPVASPAPSANARSAAVAPNPSGLRPVFPAGLGSGSGAAVSSDPIAATAAPSTIDGRVGGAMTVAPNGVDGLFNPNAAAATTALGGSGNGSRGPGQYLGSGTSGFSATDIARSFLGADANRDGDLTPAEARRLTISMMSFEEMDRNFNGLVSRSEYEDGLR